MKFNPYAVLLTTGALMFLTVVLAQTGASAALVKAGARSVDRDVSSFAARTFMRTAGEDGRGTRGALIDRSAAGEDNPRTLQD